jgi:hypothetical protein
VPYAERTTVTVEKSKVEIERTLTRYGASKFFYGYDGDFSVVGFYMRDRYVQFRLPSPVETDYVFAPGHRRRTRKQLDEALDQARRSGWRSLLLCIKAKLESVESGIETFEEAFLAHIMVTDGKGGSVRIGDEMIPQIEAAYERGTPMLALGSGS